jgi:glyoxylase-like metal-dependent hydrolase (beta-lactamase superfamily II)
MIHTLTENIHYSMPVAETDRPLLGFIAGSRASLMVDSGTSPAHAREFLAAAAPYGATPPAYQFLTHWHWDHVFAIPTVGAECIAHEITAEKLREMQGLAWDNAGLEELVASDFLPRFGADCLKQEMPAEEDRVIGSADHIFTDSLELDLGGLTCRIEHLGGTHTADSSVLYVPERKVLFAGDCIYGRRFGVDYGYRLDELTNMRARLASYDAEHYLISHEPPLSREYLLGFLDSLIEAGRITGAETDLSRAKERFAGQHGRAPSKEEAEMLAMFTGPNAAQSS